MKVRNFYLKANIDGRKEELTGGPAGRNGGISVDFLVNNKGIPESAVRIYGSVTKEGKLKVHVYIKNVNTNLPLELTFEKE